MDTPIIRNGIIDHMSAETKKEALCQLVEKLKDHDKIIDPRSFYYDVIEREEMASTYIGFEIGFAHGKSKYAKEVGICIGRLNAPIVWDEESGDRVKTIILAAVPEHEAVHTHMKILAALSRSIMHKEFRDKLQESSEEEIYMLMKKVFAE